MTVLDGGGKRIAYRVERKPIRHVYIRVGPDLAVKVSVPKRTSDIDVQRILAKKQQWIETKIETLSQAKKIFENNRVLYKGEYLRVKVFVARRPNRGYRRYSKILHIYENAHSSHHEILKRFLSDETVRFVNNRAAFFARKADVSLNGVSIKETKRWGYCTRDGNLIFSWKLIALPEPLAEYVVAHEVLHLKHFNHSKKYKSEMASLLVDYKEREQTLKCFVISN